MYTLGYTGSWNLLLKLDSCPSVLNKGIKGIFDLFAVWSEIILCSNEEEFSLILHLNESNKVLETSAVDNNKTTFLKRVWSKTVRLHINVSLFSSHAQMLPR